MADDADVFGLEDSDTVNGKNDRSSIEFPYYDLDAAIRIAEVIHERAGGKCSLDQLAAFMELAPNSGGFRARIAPARTFGLIESERGTASLSNLGERVVDPTSRAAARRDAFLTVPLYRALFERFRSKLLPKSEGLERTMIELGVAPKQVSKARTAFERSAQQAGFFEHGRDRLIEPIIRQENAKPPSPVEALDKPSKAEVRSASVDSNLNPFIRGLIDKLPHDGQAWEEKERVKWLNAAAKIFDLIYEGDAEITISGRNNLKL